MKTLKTVRIRSQKLTKRKFEKIIHTIACFKESVNFLIDKCVKNPIFQKISKKGNIYYDYCSYPKIRKNFYYEWKSLFPHLHTHYCHSSARITKDILKSWNSWCFKKRKRLPNPTYKRNSMKLEECLCYLDGNYIVLVVEPRSKLYIPFQPSKHYNLLKTENHGEITLKLNPNRTVDIFIPFITEVKTKEWKSLTSIDINERSVDLITIFPTKVEISRIDTSTISTTHYTYSLKRKNIAKHIDSGAKYQPLIRKRLLNKYGRIERNKNKNDLHEIAKKINEIVNENDSIIVMENLTDIRQSNSRQKNLKKWQKRKSRNMRRRLNRWNFKQFQQYLEYKATSTGHLVEYENPRNTSKKCLKCEKITSSKNQTFVCKHCGFTINRQIQAPINIAEKFLNKRLKKSNRNKRVARPVPAERQLMKTMLGELREFKEHIVRDASQYDELYYSISMLSV
ncbi:MAG: zinc ribbon domain-containing protein [Promethearchaeota archaeon]